ncbi:UbiD family decarboxylase [Nocardia brasiliensis]|uniref:UbiD family decarboxylase n=1 Tax=Nocardia brasiliensis TaxID=37326 RepID=UPI003D8D36C2
MVRRWPRQLDLRGWLALLAGRGELRVLYGEIDPDQDVAAVLAYADGKYAVRFEAVRGAAFPLVGNTVPSREHLALAMGCPEPEVLDKLADALRFPRPCAVVEPAAAPVLGTCRTDGDLLDDLPLPVQHAGDAGRYFTSALVAVRDPRTGKVNLSVNRLQASGPRELRTLMLPGRLRSIFTACEASGTDLPVALCVGVDPLLLLASQSPPDADLDDLEVASALYPAPLEVVHVDGLDFAVPARAEMLLTGKFVAGRTAMEGPFGEFPRTIGPGGPGPVVELAARWSRRDACLQTILSSGREHFWVGGLPREARLLRALRTAGVDVAEVRLTEGGSCRLHAVISIHAARPGIARHAAMVAFTAVATVKYVVVVDSDVDIFDSEQVEWAIATRVQADRDLLVVPRTVGSGLDPSNGAGTTAKLAIDATIPDGEYERFARIASIPRALRAHLDELEAAR